MSYVPKRLIDIELLKHIITQKPVLAIEAPIVPVLSKLEKKISQIKTGGFEKIGSSLLNGLLFLGICVVIYSVLHYKYYKKKESQK